MEPLRKKIYNCACSILFPLSLVFAVYNVHAQEVIDAAGGSATGPGGTADYSIGQLVYTFNTSPGGRENQGVQQPVDYAALPVTLVSFEVNATDQQVQVRWQTTAEENNEYFTVERSGNSSAFEEVTRVNAPGNSTILRKYSWTDVNPYEGISYYRLKQTDFDKSFTYSTIKAVRINSAEGSIVVYPNPVSDFLILKEPNQGISRSYKIFDVSGKQVKSGKLRHGEMRIDMSPFSPAVYVIHYIDTNQVQKFKIIKN